VDSPDRTAAQRFRKVADLIVAAVNAGNARTLFRRLVREELNRFSADDITEAVLTTIDERLPA
jgi:hypothetical protein